MKFRAGFFLRIAGMASLFSSCQLFQPHDPIHRVTREIIRDQIIPPANTGLLHMEAVYRFYGALSEQEKLDRLGARYTVVWHAKSPNTPVELLHESLHAKTASKVHKISQIVENPGRATHSTDFAIIGQNYRNAGSVLAWKISLIQNGRVISSRQSALWE